MVSPLFNSCLIITAFYLFSNFDDRSGLFRDEPFQEEIWFLLTDCSLPHSETARKNKKNASVIMWRRRQARHRLCSLRSELLLA